MGVQLWMVLNIPWIHVCQVSAYADVAQGYVCICLHMNTINKGFFSKISTLYSIFKKSNGGLSSHPPTPPPPPPPPLVAGQWLLLNMDQYYQWICLNVLEITWINCSDYDRTLNMHDHLTCLTYFRRWLGF